MNPFATPDDDIKPFPYEEFPKPENEVTEFTGHEGVEEFQLKGLKEDEASISPSDDTTPVVKAAIFQDFKEVLSSEG
jgi:hypothetical protein